MKNPTMLVILDGFGYRKQKAGNAIAHAAMPCWNFLINTYPSTLLHASGQHVGLLPGYMGNSEVGHLTIGAGRVVKSALSKFHDAINDGSFFNNKMLAERLISLKAQGRSLHLLGLVSDGGVHSHEDHLFAFIKLAATIGLESVYIHAILDGRDTPPRSAVYYLEKLEQACQRLGCGTIASVQGRFYAMDRDKNWERTRGAYEMITMRAVPSRTLPDGTTVSPAHPECFAPQNVSRDRTLSEGRVGVDWRSVLAQSYKAGVSDEFVEPKLLISTGCIQPGDGAVFFNFRPDRAHQLTECFINPSFEPFKNSINTGNGTLQFFITTTRFKKEFAAFNNDIIFEEELVENTLLDEIVQQSPEPVFIVAETEKYAHVTYFFRGMRDIQLPHETRVLIPSIKAKNYIDHPEMSAPQITNALIHSLRSSPAFFYLVNYANADMVGHSGNFAATVKACEIVDQQLALLYHEVVDRLGGTLIVTADHGNAEYKIDEKGNPLTAHTTCPVPFVIAEKNKTVVSAADLDNIIPDKGLANIAPTILKHLSLTVPSCMEKESIFL